MAFAFKLEITSINYTNHWFVFSLCNYDKLVNRFHLLSSAVNKQKQQQQQWKQPIILFVMCIVLSAFRLSSFSCCLLFFRASYRRNSNAQLQTHRRKFKKTHNQNDSSMCTAQKLREVWNYTHISLFNFFFFFVYEMSCRQFLQSLRAVKLCAHSSNRH